MMHRLGKHSMSKRITARTIYQNWYTVYNQIAWNVGEKKNNNPVHKLTTDKLQPVC